MTRAAGLPGPAALAEPTVLVGRRFVGTLSLALFGIWMAFFTPIQLLLPQQLELSAT